jgi:hypothetical protein
MIVPWSPLTIVMNWFAGRSDVLDDLLLAVRILSAGAAEGVGHLGTSLAHRFVAADSRIGPRVWCSDSALI